MKVETIKENIRKVYIRTKKILSIHLNSRNMTEPSIVGYLRLSNIDKGKIEKLQSKNKDIDDHA